LLNLFIDKNKDKLSDKFPSQKSETLGLHNK